jgi:hypothetical protein
VFGLAGRNRAFGPSRSSLLDSTRAAGTLVGRPTVLAGSAVHTVISLGWTLVLWRWLPERHRVPAGVVAGCAIAGLDLGLIGRRYPAIAALPKAAQIADHIAFGGVVAFVLDPAGDGTIRR